MQKSCQIDEAITNRLNNILTAALNELESRELEALSSYQLARLIQMILKMKQINEADDDDNELDKLWSIVTEPKPKMTKQERKGLRK